MVGMQRRLLTTAMAVGTAFVLAAPVMFAVWAGERPYHALIRTFPGLAVAMSSATLTAIAEIAGVVTVGALVWVLFLRDLPHKKAEKVPPGLDLTIFRVAAHVWAISTAALIFVNILNSSGVSPAELAEPGRLDYAVAASNSTGAYILRFAAAAIVAIVSVFASKWTTLLIGLWASAFGVLIPVAIGQVLVGPAHDWGSDAGYLQAIASFPLLGTLAVAAFLTIAGREITEPTWRRVVNIAVVTLPVMLVTDLVLAWFKTQGTTLLGSITGWLIVARWVCLALLALAVVLLRGRTRGWALLLAMLAGAGWLAATVTMMREPPPQYFVETSVAEVFIGFDTPEAPTVISMFTQWRPNLLLGAIAVAGVVFYLGALRTARQRGIEWPVGRTISWIVGWAFFVFATSSGFGKYSASHFGIHMIMHMALSMLVPILLALGGVVTLVLRAARADGPIHGLHNWVTWIMSWPLMKVLYNPLVAFVAFISSYYGLYLTGLFEFLMTFHWGHQLMNIHFLVVGYLYYSLIIGVDRAPKPLPHIAKLGMAMAAMPFHAFFGVILMNGNLVIARQFYEYLSMPWADLAAAQEMGGGVAWAGGEIPSLMVVIALGIQWARQDKKEASRKDRHYDSGRDSEFDDYNEMLQRLAQRDSANKGGGQR